MIGESENTGRFFVNKRNSVTKNAAYIIAGKIVQAVLGLVVSMLSARYLGPSSFGLISYAASVVAFAVPIMKLGYSDILVQEIVNSPEDEGEIIGTAMLFNLVSAVACIVGVTAFTYVANPGEPATLIVCVLYSVNLLFQATEMIQYWYQAKLLSQYTTVTSLIAYILVSAYKIYLLVTEKDVYLFAISNAIDYLIISAVLILIYRKIGTKKLGVSFKRGADMFSRGKFFIISNLMVTIFAQTDRIMLKAMLGTEQVGFYSAAVACAGYTSFIFTAIIDSVRPSAFENRKISNERFENSVINCYSVIIWLSLAQCVLFTLLAPFVIRILYGTAYYPSTPVLRLVVWYTTFSYLGAVRNIWILAENKQEYLWKINLFGAIANVVLNLALIPIMGMMGAALASLVTQFFTNVIVGYIIKPIRYNNELMVKGINPKPVIAYSKSVLKHIGKRLG